MARGMAGFNQQAGIQQGFVFLCMRVVTLDEHTYKCILHIARTICMKHRLLYFNNLCKEVHYFALLSRKWEQCILSITSKPRGGHSNYSSVHMRDQRNVKKGLFF